MHTKHLRQNVSIYLISILSAVSLSAAPEFTEQPQGGYVVKSQNFSFSFKANVGDDATWDFEGESATSALLGSGREISASIENGVLSVEYTVLNVGVAQNTRPTIQVKVTDSSGTTLSNTFTVITVSKFFSNAQQSWNNGYYQNSNLGILYAGNPPYVYQGDGLGWFALGNGADITAWLYLLGTRIEWLYYSPISYPWLYSTGEGSWVYFVYTNNARWFYVNNTDEWIRVD